MPEIPFPLKEDTGLLHPLIRDIAAASLSKDFIRVYDNFPKILEAHGRKEIGGGGECTVFTHPDPKKVIALYHDPLTYRNAHLELYYSQRVYNALFPNNFSKNVQ